MVARNRCLVKLTVNLPVDHQGTCGIRIRIIQIPYKCLNALDNLNVPIAAPISLHTISPFSPNTRISENKPDHYNCEFLNVPY